MRSAETKVAESLGMSSTTDVSANVVGVSGTASVGKLEPQLKQPSQSSVKIMKTSLKS